MVWSFFYRAYRQIDSVFFQPFNVDGLCPFAFVKDYKGSSRAKSRSGAARASLGAGRDRGRRQRGDVDDDSEPSVSTADSEEEDEEVRSSSTDVQRERKNVAYSAGRCSLRRQAGLIAFEK